ncbi:uncharacterized protein PHALS_02257 [Plasmopara halstedii]|uniref:Uncharacterized protein n=1 Tax=Plasmopara halstedii TaxID=4781 RepID=A0A0P1AXK0_PLAHL|nr:uncharacterized protein PHALS_02257 [Plasmopara halstedii]CEG45924.1 hypothetical protein PHALS_02257 [Plasmopara halstedii]|eukprot:XP_024582293.1 hypothetical protein PHALS_02257 [Plasmopara halstedii]
MVGKTSTIFAQESNNSGHILDSGTERWVVGASDILVEIGKSISDAVTRNVFLKFPASGFLFSALQLTLFVEIVDSSSRDEA